MRLTKSQSITLALSVIALFFILSIYLTDNKPRVRKQAATIDEPESTRSSEKEKLEDLKASSKRILEDLKSTNNKSPQFVLHKFHRSETRDGKKLWEIEAESGQYVPEKEVAKVRSAKLWFYKENGEVITIETKKGLLSLRGAGLAEAHLSGGVTLTSNDKVTLKTDSAVYNKDHGTVTSPDYVEISSDIINVTGNKMHADISNKEFTVEKNVSSVITPKNKRKPESDEE